MNFTVPCLAAGPNAIVEFGYDDLVRLQAEFGEGYAMAIARRLGASDPEALRKCLEIGGHGGDFESALKGTPFQSLADIVGRALELRLIGPAEDDAT